ncbi:MAG: hypothetical protein RLZZ182_675 [Pseudomonadota bacterium]|jgi:hypothetical protein
MTVPTAPTSTRAGTVGSLADRLALLDAAGRRRAATWLQKLASDPGEPRNRCGLAMVLPELQGEPPSPVLAPHVRHMARVAWIFGPLELAQAPAAAASKEGPNRRRTDHEAPEPAGQAATCDAPGSSAGAQVLRLVGPGSG